MKKCPICGNEYQSENFCPICGVVLIDTETSSAVKVEPVKKSRFGGKKKKMEAPVPEEPEQDAFGEDLAPETEYYGDEMTDGADAPGADGPSEISEELADLVDGWDTGEAEESVPAWEEDEQPAPKTAPKQERPKRQAQPKKQPEPVPQPVPRRERSSSSGGGFQFHPAYVVAGVVTILLIVAVIFIVRGLKAKKAAEQELAQYQKQEEQQEGNAQQDETQDLSQVDVNTVEDSWWEYTGEIEADGGDVILNLEEPLTFYSYNTENEETLLKNVSQVYLDESSKDLSDFYGKETTVGGYLTIDGDEIRMEVMDAESEEAEDDTAIHSYQVVIADVTWSQAMEQCKSAGGYLVRINSAEEYNYIADLLTTGGYTKDHFYLGGRREDNGQEYFWVTDSNEQIGDVLNSASSWSNGYWYGGEPSYIDNGSDAVGEIQENVMNLFYVNDRWYLNDSSANLAGDYPSLMSGKTGYIIEKE